jgi:hypothetical protein
MKPCATVNALGALVTITLWFTGCGGGNAAESAPATPTPASPSASSAESSADAPAAPSSAPPAASADAPDEAADNAPGPDSRSSEVIAALVKAHRKDARTCYEAGLKQIPGLKGDVVIHFTLKPSGAVKEAELNTERSTIREPSVVNCVIDVIRGIEFPKSSKGMESTVNYPFNFNP